MGQGNAPILYLHRTGNEGAFAAVIRMEHLNRIIEFERREAELHGSRPEITGAQLDEALELWMDHSHLEGDEEDGA